MTCPRPNGMPLFDRDRNLEHVAWRMRSAADDIWDSRPEDDTSVSEQMECHAEDLEYYASLVKILMHHGTRGYYNAGCHCDWCGEANNQYYQRRSGKSRLRFVQSSLEDAP